MTDGGEEAGWAAVELDHRTLRILRLAAAGWDGSAPPDSESAFVLDTLVRSAASYGEVFGADRIETAFPDFADFFRLRGFQTDGGIASAPMDLIVHYE